MTSRGRRLWLQVRMYKSLGPKRPSASLFENPINLWSHSKTFDFFVNTTELSLIYELTMYESVVHDVLFIVTSTF